MQPASQSEHLQSTIRSFYNREVREWFSEIDLDDLDITLPRQSLAQACKHDDADSLIVTISRQLFFEAIRGRLTNLQRTIDTSDLKESVQRKTRPKVTLYFLEDLNEVEEGYSPVDGQISFRLMDEFPTTFNESKARILGNKIKTIFAVGSGYVWRKGKTMITYTDWEKGYQLQLLSRSESEARELISKVLDINNDVPDWQNLNIKENAEPAQSFPTIPDRDQIYGELRRLARRRPIADVRFQSAFVTIIGIPHPIPIMDRSGQYATALVR
jgi:hypothetical protein